MTVGAAPVKEENRSTSPWGSRVKPCLMALGADPGVSCFQEPVVDRTMRLVAVGTTFHNRRMLPEKRSAPLRMAGVAVFVDARLFELGRVRRAMRIMAISAGELSFSERHVRGALELSLSLKMALAANLGLGALVREDCFVAGLGELEAVGGFLHDGVTVHAGEAAAGMRARLPVGLHAPLMAPETGLVLDPGGLS